MKVINYIFLFFFLPISAQITVNTELNGKKSLKTDLLVEIDNFASTYHIKNNALILQKELNALSYSNIQLGTITSANAFNPLKINLFYKDFNTVIILDNRLAEIAKIDFNTLADFRLVEYVSTGNDNTIWLYNQNTQQLELFSYLTRKTRITTLPINEDVLDLKSNYNYCWLLTKNHILVYNYIGSLIKKVPNDGFTNIEENNGNLFLKKDNQLYFLSENSTEITAVKLPELLINQFLVTNETLYIYDDEMLHHFQLKKN